MGLRGEIQVFERAANQRWPISDSQRQEAVEFLASVISDSSCSKRERLGAARVLAAFDRCNVAAENSARERAAAADPDRNRFALVAAKLGIGGLTTESPKPNIIDGVDCQVRAE